LNNQDIVFGRLDEDGEKKYLYSFSPSGRENESPKVVIDSYFMAHLLMLHGVGIWHTFSSVQTSEKKNVLVLENEGALSVVRRFIFYKNRAAHLNYFQRKIFKFLEEGGR